MAALQIMVSAVLASVAAAAPQGLSQKYLPPPEVYLPPPETYLPPPTPPSSEYLPPSAEIESPGGTGSGEDIEDIAEFVVSNAGQGLDSGQGGLPGLPEGLDSEQGGLFGLSVGGQDGVQGLFTEGSPDSGQSDMSSGSQTDQTGQFDDGQYQPAGQYDDGQYRPGAYNTGQYSATDQGAGNSGQYRPVGDDGSYRPEEHVTFPPIEDFEFAYAVKDDASGNDYAVNESNKGGAYRVKLPDGRYQIVQYVIDSRGIYRTKISYIQADGSQ
ncbi:pro-resilin-like [Pollicipes pollicipes]|uniref:pro-resilin-like n=1 Tax=Pollicipes pollicipes TaxID=41117 RepID=UPI0018857689|nr:pro-resilin-like [Pollicipes pollicipes]